jgi:pimeloyl-ACP methyl ester carboxylesterase
MARAPETRFTRPGDVDIAYQTFGGGERDIVMTMGWVTHLEVMWELPELAYFLERLASLGRVIIFDKRGTGLSDRVPGMVPLEQRAEDVGAVMDAAGSERAAFVGWADGGAIGAMFAATNPERISALVLSAMAFVTTPGAIEADPATMQLMWDTIENGWGSGNLLDLAAPRRAADPRRMVPAADAAGGEDDIAAARARGRHLIEQWLKGGIDVAVDQRGLRLHPGQPAHRGQAAEPGAGYHHPRRTAAVGSRPALPGRCHVISAARPLRRAADPGLHKYPAPVRLAGRGCGAAGAPGRAWVPGGRRGVGAGRPAGRGCRCARRGVVRAPGGVARPPVTGEAWLKTADGAGPPWRGAGDG